MPAGGLAPYTLHLTQSADVVSGQFFLGTIEFDNISATIGLGGDLAFSARATGTGTTLIDATWNLAPRPTVLSGTVTTIFSST